MFQAYVDDSCAAGEVLVLGAVLARKERWLAFSREWQDRLNAAPWQHFKMSEVWDRGGDISMEHAKWHYFTFRKYIQGAIAMVVPIKALNDVVSETGLTPLGNPYQWAIKGIINLTAQDQFDWGVQEPINFIFDARGEAKQVRDAWDFYKDTIPARERSVTGELPSFADDAEVLPLQAADMWSWWCRKRWLECGTLLNQDFPIPWGVDDKIPWMVFELSENDIRDEFAKITSVLKSIGLDPVSSVET